jgi:hypothetical protein
MTDADSGKDQDLAEQSKLLLAYYTTQVPAHATYIVTGMFAFFTTFIAVVLSILQLSQSLSPIGMVSIYFILGFFSILTLGFSAYSLGRLLYYNESISVLKCDSRASQ